MDVRKGVEFLAGLYDSEAGLLREYQGHPVYFFYNDNYLALHILEEHGYDDLCRRIRDTFNSHRIPTSGNGRIEIWLKNKIKYPPRYAEPYLVNYAGGPVLLDERCRERSIWQRDDEWKYCADMLLMGVVERWLEKKEKEYPNLWESAKRMFKENLGMIDKKFEETEKQGKEPLFETYKLALLLLTAKIIRESVDEPRIMEILDKMQSENGGITTHYDRDLIPLGRQNVETTCLAIYAATS